MSVHLTEATCRLQDGELSGRHDNARRIRAARLAVQQAFWLSSLLLATPALAGSFTPPEGCTTFMTVQARQCRVSNYFKCAQDPAGHQWRTDFDQEGPFFSSRIDSEAQWIESLDSFPPVRQTLDPDPQDAASFSELVTSGTDTFAFGLSKDNGERTQVSGFDRLTGRTFTIDGITLSETEFEFTETDLAGNVLRRSRGNEYVHPEWRLFFSGPSEWDPGDGVFVPLDGSPVQFVFPGEPGFAETQPIFDCDAIMSALPSPSAEEPRG